jgi:hypothetical protein
MELPGPAEETSMVVENYCTLSKRSALFSILTSDSEEQFFIIFSKMKYDYFFNFFNL